MANKRQLELYLLRFLPYALRDDFVTVGLLLSESDGGFAEFRLTSDWRMLQCMAPDVELEWFALVESEIRKSLPGLARREELMQLVSEKFGTMLDVAPAKAVLTEDPVKEMEVLASMYLVPLERGERVQQRSGRVAIIHSMKEAFGDAGVLELMQKDLAVAQYTGAGDQFKIDFGYRVRSELKMLQAVSLTASVNHTQAVALAYRYPRIAVGLAKEQTQSSMIAVVDLATEFRDERAQFAVGMLEENSVQARTVGEMTEIAAGVRRELRV
jgi:hypothetical protein